MEAIIGTVAVAGVTTNDSVAPGGGTISAPTTAKQLEAMRRIASIFIKNAEMTVVGESEIVDEFAPAIYAGIAAAPTGILSTETSKAGLYAPEMVAMPTLSSSEMNPTDPTMRESDGPNQKTLVSGQPIQTSNETSVLPVEKNEVKELVNRYYATPTIEDQLKSGCDKVVVERTLRDEKVVVNGGKRTAICLIEEQVVDRKYLEHGHLTDLISEVRHGNIPTIRQVYLAIIDLADLATFKIFRPLLNRVKMEARTYRLRQLSADLEGKVLEPTTEREKEPPVIVDRKTERRPWYKTDHVTEKIIHTDVETKKEVEIVALNITEHCTVEMNHDAIEGLLSRRSESNDMFGDSNSLVRIENMLPPETITEINRSAMVWVRENLCSTTSEYTTVETFNRYKVDLDGFLGKKVEMSDKQITERVQTNITEYLSPSDKISLEHIDTYQQALEKFASVQKTMELKFDPQIVNTYVAPGEGVTFDDGWLTYIPGGSIVNLGVKADLGAKITGMDVFWAGVDVATFALAVVTSAGKVAVKPVIHGGVKGAAKVTAKESVKVAAKTTVKQTGRVAIHNTGKVGTKKVAMQTAKTEASTTAKTVVGKEMRAGAANGIKQSGKLKINHAGTAGAKTRPSVDISHPDVTYKNIPRSDGKWVGQPGNSVFHPDPKSIPANPNTNPYGKTASQILKENYMSDGVKFKNGYPDLSPAAKERVKIANMSADRAKNFAQGDSILAEKLRAGKADQSFVQMLERNGIDPKYVTKGDIARFRGDAGLTWHEHQDMKTMQLLSKELHSMIPHSGGIAKVKQEILAIHPGSSASGG